MKKKYTESERALGRRVFLKALGLGIAAPLALKMSGMALAEPGGAPVRLFIFFLPHGWPAELLAPNGNAGDLKASKVLDVLAPYASYVNVVTGLKNAVVDNHAAIRSVLTGNKEGQGSDSIDYLIAQKLGVKAHALGAIPMDKGWGFGENSFVIKHGDWVSATTSPAEAAKDLLGSIGPVEPGKPDESVFRDQALALTEKQLQRMQSAVGELTSEKNKLQVHLDAVQALKSGGGNNMPGQTGCSSAPSMPLVDATKGIDPLLHENLGKILDGHLELAANALLCNAARVITLQNLWTNSVLNMGFAGGPGIAKGHHDPASHSWDGNGRAEFGKIQRWFYDRLATVFLSKLNQPDPLDPQKTVLDNTLIYCCSEISDGANHNSNDAEVWVDGKGTKAILPAVLIGRAGGYLAQKGTVNVSGRTHVDMLVTLADAMGTPIGSLGSQNGTVIQELKA